MRYTLMALLLTFAASPAFAVDSWEDWDKNGDRDITEEEWDTSFAGSPLYDEWDLDNDGYVDESEYATGMFGAYDTDDDGNITEEEWDGVRDDACKGC